MNNELNAIAHKNDELSDIAHMTKELNGLNNELPRYSTNK